MTELPKVKFRELARAVEKAGFVLERSKGSHFIYTNIKTKAKISIPNHGPKVLGPGLTKGILKDAKITSEDFLKLLKG